MIEGSQISIWSNEANEPIHVYVSKKRPSDNSFKLWLLSNGTFIKANPSDNRIKDSDLRKILKKLSPQAKYVRDCWVAYHGYEKYYK